jgi:hypothetical protein
VRLPIVVFAALYSYLSTYLRSGADSPLHVPADAFLPRALRHRPVPEEPTPPVQEMEPPPGHALLDTGTEEGAGT